MGGDLKINAMVVGNVMETKSRYSIRSAVRKIIVPIFDDIFKSINKLLLILEKEINKFQFKPPISASLRCN